MSAGTYRIRVFLTGLDKERAKELRFVLHEFMRSTGKATLRDMLRRAYQGERVLVYQSNDDQDAEAVARSLRRAGAVLDIEGMRGDDELF